MRNKKNMVDKYTKLIIQMPCYDEAGALNIALDALPRTLKGVDCIEYLIINDGGRDDTLQAARQWDVNYIVDFKQNKGLAEGFMAGIDGRLCQGADIIVNADADNQYCAEDIRKLIEPILRGETDIAVGAKPIDETAHFSPVKKELRHFGSWVVRKASNIQIPDVPSGFRTYSREAAVRMNIVNDYTYTLETIVQVGREKISMTSVPVRTNGGLRPFRLFDSIWGYVKESMIIIIRAYMVYKPLKCFTFLYIPPILVGTIIGVHFLIFYFKGTGTGHVQSLILACTLIIIGFLTLMMGLLGDILASNKKLLEDTQYHVRRIEYDILQNKRETKEYGEGTGDAEGDTHE